MKKNNLLKNWKLDLVLLMMFTVIGVFFLHSDFDLVGFAVVDLNETNLTEVNETFVNGTGFNENISEVNVTGAPIQRFLVEEVSKYNKRIIVNEKDVLVSVLINEVPLDAITVYRIKGGEKLIFNDVDYIDSDKNGLVEEVRWIGLDPGDVFEVTITILNVQSYPSLHGNWTVGFDTTGIADLIITASNGTTWAEEEVSGIDLEFIEIRCGNESLDYGWIDDSVVVYNYSCDETGLEVSSPHTIGKHTIRFEFGSQVKYAYNYVGNAPSISWDPPTPNDGQTIGVNSVYINTTVTDDNLTVASLDWNSSLVGYWQFDEYNNSGVFDNSTNDNFCTFGGGVAASDIGSSKFGEGITFEDSKTEYLSCGTSLSDFNIGTGNFTVEAWVKSSGASDLQIIIGKGTWTQFLRLSGTGLVQPVVGDQNGNYRAPSSNPLSVTDGNWHHIAVTHSYYGSTVVWVDGIQKGSSSLAYVSPISDVDLMLYIGRYSGGRYFNGMIDELKFHRRILSSQELNASINASGYRLFNNFTELNDAVYSYSAYLKDADGNLNISTRSVTINTAGDFTYPLLTLDYPQNITYNYNTSLPLNYTATDDIELDTVWYNIDGAANTTLSGNTTFDTSEGSHILNIWANDSVNNINQTNVSFFVDLHPLIDWESPTPDDDETVGINSVYLNTTVTDYSNTSAFFDWNYSLAGYWSMDFYNDTGIFDNSTNDNFCTFGDSISVTNITNGIYGKALNFSSSVGATTHLDCGNDSYLHSMDELTISAWVRWGGGAQANEETIVSNWQASDTDRSYLLRWDSATSKIEFYTENVSGDQVGEGFDSTDISDGGWHHLVAVYNGAPSGGLGGLKVYLDGNLSGTNPRTAGTLGIGESPTYIGNSPHVSTDFFRGDIDEVTIHRRIFTQQEVNATYRNSLYKLYNNFTGLSNGATYNYSVYAIDEAGNLNITTLRGVIVNSAPTNPSPTLNSTDETNKTTQMLNCFDTITDPDSDELNVSVRWFKDDVLNQTFDYNGSYASETSFSVNLTSGNTTKADVWICSMRLHDGNLASDWVNSSDLTILNTVPSQVTLSSPGDTSSTNDRTPTFSWNAASDDDSGDSITYVINVDNDNDFSSCIINESGISDATYTPGSDLDLDDTYYWRVVAYDAEEYGTWSATWSFDLNSLLIVDLVSDTMDFGNVDPGVSYNTTDDSPNPFVLQNDGNALANVSLNASSLFDSVSLPDSSYQVKIDNVTAEAGSFNWIDSLISWFNMPSATTLAIVELKYEDATDSVETDILITPPLDELTGSKSSSIIFTSSLAE